VDPGDESRRRREADKWIAKRLKEIDYDLSHPEAQQFADHLYSLGVGTLINLKKMGTLFAECRKLTPGGLPPAPPSWSEESQRVVVVTVRTATPKFITRSMRTWDPLQSALDTYFVNYCLITFKGVFGQYCKEEAQASAERPTDNVIEMFDTGTAAPAVEDAAIARATVREITTLVGDADFTEYVRLTVMGKTQAQAADALGISASTLARRLAAWRQKIVRGGWPAISRREGDGG
jgi:hypothetical protein